MTIITMRHGGQSNTDETGSHEEREAKRGEVH